MLSFCMLGPANSVLKPPREHVATVFGHDVDLHATRRRFSGTSRRSRRRAPGRGGRCKGSSRRTGPLESMPPKLYVMSAVRWPCTANSPRSLPTPPTSWNVVLPAFAPGMIVTNWATRLVRRQRVQRRSRNRRLLLDVLQIDERRLPRHRDRSPPGLPRSARR